jgi:hypothetical protein
MIACVKRENDISIARSQRFGYYLPMDRKQTSIRLAADTLKRLKILAVEHDKSLNEILLEAIQDLLRKYEKKNKK